MITDPAQIAEYQASRFWDAFTDTTETYSCDTALVNGVPKAEVEKALAAYLTVLEQQCSLDFSRKAMASFFKKIEVFEAADTSSNIFGFFESKVPHYLYDPNSPLRDEDLYLPFVRGLSVSEYVSEDLKPAYAHDAAMCSLNQAGQGAADFSFTEANGKKNTLYGIKADYTLLFFSNPGCPACKEIIEALKNDTKVSDLISSGRLSVVNLYIDLELDKWRACVTDYPSDWHNGYDQSYIIRTDVTYNVRAIPSLYVLDREKKVIMKDAPAEKALAFLDSIQ